MANLLIFLKLSFSFLLFHILSFCLHFRQRTNSEFKREQKTKTKKNEKLDQREGGLNGVHGLSYFTEKSFLFLHVIPNSEINSKEKNKPLQRNAPCVEWLPVHRYICPISLISCFCHKTSKIKQSWIHLFLK